MSSFSKILKKDWVKSFIICACIAFISLLPLVIKGKGFFVLTNDFNDQQIPFTIGLHNNILDGGIGGFSWDIDLGTSTLQGMSFYEMGSPFFWITMLFPANAFPYYVAYLFVLKFALAGAFSEIYLSRFVKDGKWAVLGSVLYAFSGFSLTNMLFYHFHEAIVFFPLMLIGLERFKEKNKFGLFIFSIFLNCFVNYFFFMGSVVFLIFYYLFRFASKDIKAMLMDIVKCIGCGVLGVAMAACMFIPNILFAMGNPRTGAFAGILGMLKLTLPEYLYIIKCLLLPGETMTDVSAIYAQNFSSHGMYLPLVGAVLVIAYILKKKDRLSGLIIFCTVASFIPLLSDLFFMYSAAQMRWWYAFNLMVVLASIKILDETDAVAIKKATAGYIGLIIIFVISITALHMVNDSLRFYGFATLAVVGALVTCFITNKEIINYKRLMSLVCVVSLGLTLVTVFYYKKSDWLGYQGYKARYDIAKELELPNEQYRLNDTMNLVSMMAHVAGFTNQTSTNANSIFEFEALFDYHHNVAGMPKNDIPGLAELLGGKYYLTLDDVSAPTIQTFDTVLGTIYLKEREACPIGFAVDSYISTDELMSLPVEQRAVALLDSAVVDEKIDLPKSTAADIDFTKSISEYVTEHTRGAVQNFHKDGHGMYCTTNYDKETYVYFSVPFDAGWTAAVDNEQVDIANSGGMMLIKVPAGEHSIVFKYYTPGLALGLIVTVLGWFVFVALIIFKRTKR